MRLVMSSRGFLTILFLLVGDEDFVRTYLGFSEEKGGMFSMLSFSQNNRTGAAIWL